MNYNKNQEIKLRINDIGSEGEGIGRTEDGATFFVKGALPGEAITASVLKWKKSYGYARLLSIDEVSPDRVEPVCSIASKCGGCSLQHLAYKKQLEWKQNKVLNCITRIGGFDYVPLEKIRGMQEPFYYRNKAQFPIQWDSAGKVKLGFYAGHTHSVIDTKHCYIQAGIMNDLLEAIRGFVEENNISTYDEETGKGLLRHILVRIGVNTKEVCICPVINGKKLPKWEALYALTSEVCKKLDYDLTSFCVDFNTEDTNVILSDKFECLAGRPFIYDTIGEIAYRISPLSFYQVNPVQTKVIYDTVKKYAALTGKENLWDIYCGTGTIGLYLAKDAKKLTGIEIVPEAIADAKENAAYNHIDNAEFYVGAAEDVLPKLVNGAAEDVLPKLVNGTAEDVTSKRAPGAADEITVAVIDPPRKGCDPVLLDTLLTLSPERIVYVSCDPATLARDLRILVNGGYSLERVRPVDAFCNTTHVETVALLCKQHGPDYTGLKLQELTYATLSNRKGEPQDYKLDVLTAPDRTSEKQPVMIFIHGGGFIQPCDKRQGYIPDFARKYVEMGYTVISPDYPVFDDGNDYNANMGDSFSKMIAPDAEAIVEVVKFLDVHADELGLDMSRLAIGGGSAGGMTSIFATSLLKERLRCVINCWGSPEELPDLTGFPPVLSIHGTGDTAVPYELETVFRDALEKAGIVHELITLEDAPHTPMEYKDEYFPAMEAFMKKYM